MDKIEREKIKNEWFVERNNGIRQVVAKKCHEVVVGNLGKELAFHLEELHNNWLKNEHNKQKKM